MDSGLLRCCPNKWVCLPRRQAKAKVLHDVVTKLTTEGLAKALESRIYIRESNVAGSTMIQTNQLADFLCPAPPELIWPII